MSKIGIIQGLLQATKPKEAPQQQPAQQTFSFFIWQNKLNRRFVLLILAGTVLQFIIFKYLYPFADFFSDSYSYIFAASANLDVSIWPIGYSKFLRYFHFITHSDTALIASQYFFLELSCLYFFFTILYFYKPVKTNQVIILMFLFFNPLFLYISNYVNSDPVFIALSVLWFTELLWILQKPNLNHILIQGLLLFLCFTIRNNAYIYPFVTIVAFSVSRLRPWIKVAGAAMGILLIIPFILHTRSAAYKITGTKQFSLFTGWQLANNALYMYEYADTAKQLSGSDKELDRLSIWFYSIVPKDFRSNYLLTNPGNFFIQSPASPLKQYLARHYKIDDRNSGMIAWGKASTVFNKYGNYLIKHNPKAYLYEFMMPNTKNYFVPHLEKLQVYNLGDEKVDPIAAEWFQYKSNKIKAVSKNIQGYILYAFPYLFMLINIYLLTSTIIFWLKEKYKLVNPYQNRSLLLTAVFYASNYFFLSFTTIIVLRYQIFPMILYLSFTLLLTEWIYKDVPGIKEAGADDILKNNRKTEAGLLTETRPPISTHF